MAQVIPLSMKSLWEIKAYDETEYDRLLITLKSESKIICTDKEYLIVLIAANDINLIATALGRVNPPIRLSQQTINKKRPDLI